MLKKEIRLSAMALTFVSSLLLVSERACAADFIVQKDISQSRRLEKYVHSKGSLDDTVDEYEIKVPSGKYAIVSVSGERSVEDVECASGLYVGSRQYINSDIELRCNAGTSYITVRLSVSIFDYQTHACQWRYWIKIKYYDLVPDLTVSRVDLSLSDAAVDETVTLTYTIRNIGQLNVPVSTVARIYDGNKQICGNQTVQPITAGSAVTQSVTLPRLSAGEHSLKVVADATGAVNESNESNNDEVARLRVYARTPVEVTFNLNGAGPAERRTVIAGNLLGAPLPLATRRGYAFNGWWTELDGGTKVAADAKITRDCVFYAHWSAFVSEISFNRQSGMGGDETTTATFDDNMPRVSVPSRRGYVFGGYWQYPNGYGKQYYDESGRSTCRWDCILKEVTLYAKWTAVRGSVNFDFQGGANGTKSTETMFESALPKIVVPMRSSWVFQGYFSSPNGNGVQYYSSSGQGTRIWNILGDSDVTLYAYWLPVRMDYQVRFDRQSGSGGADGASVTYASDMSDIKCPSRAQYIFEGYYSEPNGGGTCYYDQMGRAMQKWDRNQDVTLYAKWSKAYRVCFSPNGADGADRIQYFTERTWQLAKNEYSRSGYVFAGWALESDGVPVLPDEAIVSKALLNLDDDPEQSDVTLYAQWGRRLSTPIFPGVEFVTGGDREGSGWRVEDGVLRSSPLSGTSWLCVEFLHPNEVQFGFENSNLGVVTATYTHTGTTLVYVKGCPDADLTDVRISAGKRLLTWVCEKKMLSLKDWGGKTPTDDHNRLLELLEAKESKVEELIDLLCDLVSSAVYACDQRPYRRATIESETRDAADYAVRMIRTGYAGGADVLQLMQSWLIDPCNEDITIFKRDLNIGSYDGIEMKRLAKEIESILADVIVIDDFIGGYGVLTSLVFNDVCRVGFVVGEGAEYDKALEAFETIERAKADLSNEIEPDLIERVTRELKVHKRSWTSADDARVRFAIDAAIDHLVRRVDWSDARSVVVSKLANGENFDVTELKHVLYQYYTDNGAAISGLCRQIDSIVEEILAGERLISASDVVEMRSVIRGVAIGALPEPIEHIGYDCKGWWTAPNGGKLVDEKMVVMDDMALYARYELKTFEILFDANGGAGGSGRTVRFGDALGELPIPIRTGYAFAGWLRRSDGAVVSSLDIPQRDETYQAQWTKNTDWAKDNPAVLTYSLSFNANGGMGAMVPIAMETSKVYNLPPNAFIPPSGKRFAGWICSKNGRRYDDGMLVFNLAQPGETATMTAVWK